MPKIHKLGTPWI